MYPCPCTQTKKTYDLLSTASARPPVTVTVTVTSEGEDLESFSSRFSSSDGNGENIYISISEKTGWCYLGSLGVKHGLHDLQVPVGELQVDTNDTVRN
jgi:hypothetical protein